MTYLMNTIARKPVTFTGGDGPYLFTGEGAAYLDFFCDVGTSSLGYCSPESGAALRLAMEYPIHSPNLFGSSIRDDASEKLCRAANMDKAFFCNSGAESVEAAIKLARLYQHQMCKHRKRDIWTQVGSFHGRTLATIAAGDGPAYHTEGFGPRPEGFIHYELPRMLVALEYTSDPPAAIIISPVRGNNDVRANPTHELMLLRQLCTAHDVVLVFDEVQSGAGRASNCLTYGQSIGVIPDVVTLAKGIAMGAPVAATLARGKFADVFLPGTHFSTFGGNPFCCVMLSAMLDWLSSNAGRSNAIGLHVRERLEGAKDVANLRNVGGLIAFDHPNPMQLAARALERKLLIGAFRDGPGVVKLTPPLNIAEKDLNIGLDRLIEALNG